MVSNLRASASCVESGSCLEIPCLDGCFSSLVQMNFCSVHSCLLVLLRTIFFTFSFLPIYPRGLLLSSVMGITGSSLVVAYMSFVYQFHVHGPFLTCRDANPYLLCATCSSPCIFQLSSDLDFAPLSLKMKFSGG